MQAKQWLMIGALSGFFGVALGAFGAHGLKEILSQKSMAIYQTAVQYQMYHALALLALGVWGSLNPGVDVHWTGLAFTFGILIFSGSLYALAVTDLKFLGAITPIGGVAFLAGWITFAIAVWKA